MAVDNIIHEFYVVTKTSVYHVTDTKDKDGNPIVTKIAIGKNKGSKLRVGSQLKGGNYFGITDDCGIILYRDNGQRSKCDRIPRPGEVSMKYWSNTTTSPIVALFFEKGPALECVNSDGLKMWDPRWYHLHTKEVLEKIGDDHKVFILDCFVLDFIMV